MLGKHIATFLSIIIMNVVVLLAASPSVLTINEVFTHNEKGNFGGLPSDMISGTGMNGNPNEQYAPPTSWSWPTSDPSTWTTNGTNRYWDEWQSNRILDSVSSVNNKIGFAIFDLGEIFNLEIFYIWNERENSNRYTKTFSVYLSSSPTVLPTHGPTNSTTVDCDFSSGGTGWTLINSGGELTGTHQGNQTIDLSSHQGRYIAVEILTNNGDPNRVGLAEVGVTGSPLTSKGTFFLIE